MQNEEVKHYYDFLMEKKHVLFLKRMFDIAASALGIIILIPFFIIVSAAIVVSTKESFLFFQKRIGRYGKSFYIIKFKTMRKNNQGLKITAGNDKRVTPIGAFLRKTKIDELPQLFNVLAGRMSFVGTRPEVGEYVEHYKAEMFATLLLRPGITSPASIKYKNESELLAKSQDPNETYIKNILPEKMTYNLEYIKNISFANDVSIILKTLF